MTGRRTNCPFTGQMAAGAVAAAAPVPEPGQLRHTTMSVTTLTAVRGSRNVAFNILEFELDFTQSATKTWRLWITHAQLFGGERP